MKITLNWLKEHLDTTATLIEISERLTMLGLEVDGIEDRAKGLESFVVGEVVSAARHPDADKLQICTLDAGSGTLDVVCGAPNARAGLKGVFAASGSYIPGLGLTLKKAKIRGVESNGMLLSAREMGLSDEHEGIVELPANAPVGASAVEVMGLGDPIIDIAMTPNRGDCLGVRGIARDLAASGLGTLKPLDDAPVPGTFESPVTVDLDFEDAAKDACPYFVGRYIRGLKNNESPKWLKDKLTAVGLRPISALVDITNLMTLDLNRPLHVFDADKLDGDLRVRLARDGEAFTALDGKDYELDETMTVIADAAGADALGGVMGGERTGCGPGTVNVFVESAYFDPIRTAATGRKLNLMSDARYRFERGIDPAFLIGGMEIATRLILDLCGGEASGLVVAGAEPDPAAPIPFRPARVRELGGVEMSAGAVTGALRKLGFGIEGEGESVAVSIPTWRGDIVGPACLVEEAIRIYGYDHIPTVPLQRDTVLPPQALNAEQNRRVKVRRTLAGRGLVEAVTLSFMAAEQADLFGGAADDLRLVNPISSDLGVMRPSILPNLIAAAGRNADRGVPDARLFELGPQYASAEPDGQATVASGLRSGRTGPRNWAQAPRPVDAFDAKADVLAALGALGLPTGKVQVRPQAPAWYHPGRSGSVQLGPKTVLAHFGEVHPGALAKMGVKGPMAAFEIYLDNAPKPKARKSAARPHLTLSALQPVERDFAFVLDRDVPAAALIKAAFGADKALIAGVRVFDLFEGGALGEGKKSLAVTVTLQPKDKTLTEGEIEAVSKKIVENIHEATGGDLRS